MSGREIIKWPAVSSLIASIQKKAGPRLDLEELAGTAAKGLAEIFDNAGFAVYLVDEHKDNILAEIGSHEGVSKIAFSSDMPAMTYFTKGREGVIVSDIPSSPFFGNMPVDSDIQSILCAPVIALNETRGLLFLSSSAPDRFSGDDLELLELLAKEVSVTYEIFLLHGMVSGLTVRDRLTGCFNRVKFEEDIEIEIPCAERYGRPLSLLILDVDWFRYYNAFHGVDKGDNILGRIGEILGYSLRVCDKLYRYSGEQFAVILPGISREQALFAAKRIHNVLRQHEFEGEAESQPSRKLTFSIGVASFPSDAVFKDGLLKAAFSSLHKAKESGRNTVC